jgi:uncharacterized protein (DUF2236 family)
MEEKKQLLQTMRASKEIQTMDDTPNWRRAFDMYWEATGTRLRTKDRCSKCFNMVIEWLEA